MDASVVRKALFGNILCLLGGFGAAFPVGAPARADEPRLEVRYPGPRQSRTVLEAVLAVPARLLQRNNFGYFNLIVSGEVRHDGHPYDRFRYRYDVAGGASGAAAPPLAVTFQRTLRPGRFQLVLEVRDLQSGWGAKLERWLDVPRMAVPPTQPGPVVSIPSVTMAPTPPPSESGMESASSVAEPHIEIVPPTSAVMTGGRRVAVEADPTIAAVRFVVDGRPVMTKRGPPFSVELAVGDGRPLMLRAEGLDAAGQVLAYDELLINAPEKRFRVRIVEPRASAGLAGVVKARADVDLPGGEERVAEVEFRLDDETVCVATTLPFVCNLSLPYPPELRVLVVRARLADGLLAEDTRVLNVEGQAGHIDVDYVELYTAALDMLRRPVTDLDSQDFEVRENGTVQKLARCERVADLPTRVTLLLDVSGSMIERLKDVTAAAMAFLDRSLRPGDEASVVTFAGSPRTVVEFTSDRNRLGNGLTALEAGGSTAILDSLVFVLDGFEGRSGQRAVLLLSDGEDHGSRHSEEDVLALARRRGVTVYPIAIHLAEKSIGPREFLQRLGDETGGRTFFIAETGDLGLVYREIERDLRTRYLLAYPSSTQGSDYRRVEVAVNRPGVRARTISGYYP